MRGESSPVSPARLPAGYLCRRPARGASARKKMNETLIVKDFGPIREAEVQFKRVTVFIGPTGGGKSTLAKLAAIFRNEKIALSGKVEKPFSEQLGNYGLVDFEANSSCLEWDSEQIDFRLKNGSFSGTGASAPSPSSVIGTEGEFVSNQLAKYAKAAGFPNAEAIPEPDKEIVRIGALEAYEVEFADLVRSHYPAVIYIPAERVFLSAISGSLAGLTARRIALSSALLEFASDFEVARQDVKYYKPALFDATYSYQDGENFILLSEGKKIRLRDAASGIQSALPVLLVADFAAKQLRSTHFIIEEPELNLFPEAQQALLNVLIEKCAQAGGKNDLIITTHSPYLLSHLNLLLYAPQVAKNHPERAEEIKAMVPEPSWIQPGDLAVYYIDGPKEDIRSLLDPETGLIAQNALDGTAGQQADAFDRLLDINSGF